MLLIRPDGVRKPTTILWIDVEHSQAEQKKKLLPERPLRTIESRTSTVSYQTHGILVMRSITSHPLLKFGSVNVVPDCHGRLQFDERVCRALVLA